MTPIQKLWDDNHLQNFTRSVEMYGLVLTVLSIVRGDRNQPAPAAGYFDVLIAVVDFLQEFFPRLQAAILLHADWVEGVAQSGPKAPPEAAAPLRQAVSDVPVEMLRVNPHQYALFMKLLGARDEVGVGAVPQPATLVTAVMAAGHLPRGGEVHMAHVAGGLQLPVIAARQTQAAQVGGWRPGGGRSA